MSEIVQKVRTVFTADASGMHVALPRIKQDADAADNSVKKLQSSFGGLGSFITAAMGAMALKSLVSFNTEIENTRLGIASLLKSGDKMRGVMTPFATSAREAEEAFTMMRKAAITTPATTMQVADAFKVLALRARVAGMATKDLVALSANVATKDMMMGGKGLVQMDIEQLLRGQSGQIATPELNMNRQRLAEMGRGGQSKQLLREVQRLLEVGPDEQAAWGASSGGMFATLQDQWDLFKEEVGKPVMGALIRSLKDVLKWLEKNKKLVKDIADAIGEGIVGAFKALAWVLDSNALKLLGFVVIIKKIGQAWTGMMALMAKHPVMAALMAAVTIVQGVQDATGAGKKAEKSELGQAEERFSGNVDDARKGRAGGYASPFAEAIWKANQLQSLDGVIKAANEAGVEEMSLFGRRMTPDDYGALVSEATKALGAGFGPEQLQQFEAERAALKKAEEEAAAALNGFASATNGVIAKMAALGIGLPAMEADALGNKSVKKGWISVPQLMANSMGGLNVKNVEVKKAPVVDARGSKITVNQQIKTDDPGRLAGATLTGAFVGAFARPLSANMGLGSLALTGGS